MVLCGSGPDDLVHAYQRLVSGVANQERGFYPGECLSMLNSPGSAGSSKAWSTRRVVLSPGPGCRSTDRPARARGPSIWSCSVRNANAQTSISDKLPTLSGPWSLLPGNENSVAANACACSGRRIDVSVPVFRKTCLKPQSRLRFWLKE